uniref:C3H1-type domain-containing protein n=1 Tax=Macrostomum lignano TaxID=282301 RepID=A0A1I8I2Y6_9PLAT
IIDDQSTGGQEATGGAAGDLAALRKEVEELEIKALTQRRVESGQSARKRSRAYLIRDFVKPNANQSSESLTTCVVYGNAQILQRLIDDGSLIYLNDDGSVNTSELRGYLLYSQKIGELLDANYSPNVVWEFDEDYRKLMAESELHQWGCEPPQLYHRHLNALRNLKPQAPVCLSFNSTAGCQRSSCRYRHVCKLPGCGKPHPAQLHRQSSDAAEGSTAYRH